MEAPMRYRVAGALAAVGLLFGGLGGYWAHRPPFLLQQLLQHPMADALVVVLALATVVSLGLWGWQPGYPDRRAFVAALTLAGGLVVFVNVLAPAIGWWGGPIFDAPLLPVALLIGLSAAVCFALLLLLYRWLATRWRRLALLCYLLLLLALIPATILGDPLALDSGLLTFGGGYTIWHDLLLGEILFALPLIAYVAFRRYLWADLKE